jgi:uncharacterized protein YbjT (DUF2867 family)
MNVVLFGASGMVGQGVLRECLLASDVASVLSVGRSTTPDRHPKLHQIVHADLVDYSAIEGDLAGQDACFFCLGVSSAGMTEEAYRKITHDLTLAAATVLARLNPAMTFVYVSGAGTDSSESGRSMWARVKGKTENDLLRLPFKAAYMFRPAAIRPLHGVKSKTPLYNAFYTFTGPLLGLLHRWTPSYMTTTEQMGRAMLAVARHGGPKAVLESADINLL